LSGSTRRVAPLTAFGRRQVTRAGGVLLLLRVWREALTIAGHFAVLLVRRGELATLCIWLFPALLLALSFVTPLLVF
jgi:hypothetical protein